MTGIVWSHAPTLPASMPWAPSQVGCTQEWPPSEPPRWPGCHKDPWTQAEAPRGPARPGGPGQLSPPCPPPPPHQKPKPSEGRLDRAPDTGRRRAAARTGPVYSRAVGGRGPVVEGGHFGLERGSGDGVAAGGHELQERLRQGPGPQLTRAGALPFPAGAGAPALQKGPPAPRLTPRVPGTEARPARKPTSCEAARLQRTRLRGADRAPCGVGATGAFGAAGVRDV